MRCPKCQSTDLRVLDTRAGKEGSSIRRRRECGNCGHRFSTVEEIMRENLQVVKRDGRREEFERGKLLSGLCKAVEKRPIDALQIEMLVAEVMAEVERNFDQEVPSSAIGELIMQRLRNLDTIAYVRYASVYKDFRDLSELEKEIRSLSADSAAKQG
jgi:transcriptional repressor NrdR